MMNVKMLTRTAMLAALALIFGYVESLFPLPVAIPGIKLGLSNIAVVFALYRLGIKPAAAVMLVKVLVSSLLWGGMSALWYSLCGGVLSLLAMAALKRHLSPVGLCVLGGISHNIGQLAAAAVVLSSAAVFYYLPVLLAAGVAVGLATGAVCAVVLSRI